MNHCPLVTVIIPTYNRPRFFREALESVLAQTYRNLDIFITDNSTNTQTRDFIQAYLERDSRITYEYHPEFHSSFENISYARRYNNPNAEYVNYLMDDDLFHPEKIATMVKAYQQVAGISLVTSYRQVIDTQGNILPDILETHPICERTTRFDGQYVGMAMLTQVLNFVGEPTTVLMKKSYLHRGDLGWSGREQECGCFVTDFPTWLHLLTQGDMLYIRKPLSYFRQHSSQMQKDLGQLAKVLTCWGMEISYARETGQFLSDDARYEDAILCWLGIMYRIFLKAKEENFVNERLLSLQRMGSQLLLDMPHAIRTTIKL